MTRRRLDVEPTFSPDGEATFSEREQQIIASALRSGANREEIARDLGISPHTVASHVANIIEKTDQDGRAGDWVIGLLRQGKIGIK
jgi:DNA-binding NarL/FixJ family response regulator